MACGPHLASTTRNAEGLTDQSSLLTLLLDKQNQNSAKRLEGLKMRVGAFDRHYYGSGMVVGKNS